MTPPILSAWTWPAPPSLSPVSSGLINETHAVRCSGQLVAFLQRLNTAIFVPEVHEDIEAITTRLSDRGLVTPRLLRTSSGALWATDTEGGVWRCLTPVGDRTVEKLVESADARSAGALVARFHRAVRDLDWEFRSVRAGAQDTEKHLANLRDAVAEHANHRLYDQVAPLAQEILRGWERWQGPTDLPSRVIHGDLKISNVRFEGERAVALIDLDTLARRTLDVELGDAFRSWCNPASEDAAEAVFDLDLFEAGIRGYASEAGPTDVTDEEWASVVPGIERISLNLAARFAADALQESYFGWDPRHGGRGEHNLLRARGQWSLSRKVAAARARAEAITRSAR